VAKQWRNENIGAGVCAQYLAAPACGVAASVMAANGNVAKWLAAALSRIVTVMCGGVA